tara:strand:+ start:161 stop:283 length:123 start_codon:yes stop_codon:yes gene_type:complete
MNVKEQFKNILDVKHVMTGVQAASLTGIKKKIEILFEKAI